MTAFQAIAFIGGGLVLLGVAMLVFRHEGDAPRDWRYWTGSFVGVFGVGAVVAGAMALLEVR
jgi:hypothetical protein